MSHAFVQDTLFRITTIHSCEKTDLYLLFNRTNLSHSVSHGINLWTTLRDWMLTQRAVQISWNTHGHNDGISVLLRCIRSLLPTHTNIEYISVVSNIYICCKETDTELKCNTLFCLCGNTKLGSRRLATKIDGALHYSPVYIPHSVRNFQLPPEVG